MDSREHCSTDMPEVKDPQPYDSVLIRLTGCNSSHIVPVYTSKKFLIQEKGERESVGSPFPYFRFTLLFLALEAHEPVEAINIVSGVLHALLGGSA